MQIPRSQGDRVIASRRRAGRWRTFAPIGAAVLWFVTAMSLQPARATDTFPGETISGSATIVRSNVGATSETGETVNYAPGNTMWYSWTAPATGRLNVGTCNRSSGGSTSTFDTTIAVFTGTTVSGLTSLGSNDDTTGCATDVSANYGSTLSVAVTAGSVYRVQVDGYSSSTGTFLLHYGLASIVTAITDASATEGGDTAAFTVRLNSVPTANVTVTIGTSTQCTFAPTTLTFTPANWSTAQTVTVTATNDTVYESTHSCSPASISAGATGGYTGVTATPPTLTVNDNDPANFTITKTPSVASIAAPGTISYTIVVDNISAGNLTGPVMTDALTQGGASRTLTSGPTYVSGDTDGDGRVDSTEIWTYTASYAVTQADIDNGGTFSNVATFDTNQSGPIPSAPATTTVTQSPSFSIAKARTSGPATITAAGQAQGYTITVANTGNLTLTGVSISDALTQAGSPRTLASGPSYASGDTDSDSQLDVGETWTYSAGYAVTQIDMDNGGTFSNTATFDTAQTAPTTSTAVTTPVTQSPSMTISKSADAVSVSGNVPAGHVVTYTYTVTNNGNVTISNVTISDAHDGLGTHPAPGGETGVVVTNGSSDPGGADGSWDSLRPGDQIAFTATYAIDQLDIDQRQ